MSIHKNGILGDFTGRCGNTIFYKVGDQVRGRTVAGRFHDAQTPKQLAQRMKMKMVVQFLKGWKHFIRRSYTIDQTETYANCRARTRIMKEAIEGVYPDLKLNYSKIPMSQETITGIESLDLERNDGAITLRIKANYDEVPLGVYAIVIAQVGKHHHQFAPQNILDNEMVFTWDLIKKKEPDSHFWIMLYDPIKNHYYGSVYRS